MGFIFNARGQPSRRSWGISYPTDLIPRRSTSSGHPYISADTAMNNSAVWAALRLRADLMSTLPIDGFRKATIDGEQLQLEAGLTPFMNSPDFMEWRYSSQIELDRSGNSIGIILEKNSQGGFPTAIELQPSAHCSLVYRDGKLSKYRIAGALYDPVDIWHEKQFTVSGFDLGLNPVAHAAWVLGQYVSIQQFATDWFIGGATPRARLRNTAKKLNQTEALKVKESWRASRAADEPFVHGNDWEYELIQAQQASSDWMQAQNYSYVDLARFFGVPADLIDAAVSGQSVTYANITQRNLQFLIMHLGPAIARRELALSQLLPKPRFIKFNTDALLRMDPMTRAMMIRTQIESRTLAPSEARLLDNRTDFTQSQIEEFDKLGLNKKGSTEATSLAPLDPSGNPAVGPSASGSGEGSSAPAAQEGN
jgi:HK97 family phage portal protein